MTSAGYEPRWEDTYDRHDPRSCATNYRALTSRLERTEKQLRVLRFAIPALAILVGVAFFIQLDKPTVISAKAVNAESFSVRNAKGDIVAQMSAGSEGSPSFVLLDADKKIRLMATVGAKGPSLSLLDPQQVYRATLSLNDQSDPSLTMSNAEKLTRSVFAIDKAGSGHLVLYGSAGGLDLAAADGRDDGRHLAVRQSMSCRLRNNLTQTAMLLVGEDARGIGESALGQKLPWRTMLRLVR